MDSSLFVLHSSLKLASPSVAELCFFTLHLEYECSKCPVAYDTGDIS